MRMRAYVLALGFVAVSIPAHAQTPTPGGGRATIEFLYNELMALKAHVARLESRQVVAADLVGRYSLQMLGVEMGENPYIATESAAGIMTLRADGIVEFVGSDGQGRCELELSRTPSVTCDADAEAPGTLTWRFENGHFIFTDEDGEHAILVGAGGLMMMAGDAHEFVPGHSWANIFMAMRLPN